MFDWANKTYFPRISDLFNMSDLSNMDWMDMFTYIWVAFLGPWFFGILIGTIAAAIYIKFNNAIVAIAFLIIASALLGVVLPVEFLFIVGLLAGIVIGILFYQAFISKEE
jgi:phosphotransferase system  glucose/maltose/N-acetylglucosamine-specific IIC component